MTKSSIEAYLKNIKSGKAKSHTERIIEALMWRQYASTYELSQDVGVKVNTVGARLNALLSIGCVYECGDRTHNNKKYTLYIWIRNKENWPRFGQAYRKKLALRRASGIVNNAGDHSRALAVRAQLEVDVLKGEIRELERGLPDVPKHVA